MPFKKVDMDAERNQLDELLKNNPEAQKAKRIFDDEYKFRLQLAKERKSRSITQQKIEEQSGLTQQVISRMERGTPLDKSPTLRTVFRYLDAMGCELHISSKEEAMVKPEK